MQKRTRLLGVAAGLAAATVVAGTAFAETAPSFQEFAGTTYQDTDGQYIVNGDEVVESQGGLRQFYDIMVKQPKRTSSTDLIINTVRGQDDRWTAAQARDLRYCVSTAFGADHARMVQAMAAGAALWENASSGVDFVYVSSADSNCDTRNRSVVFSVEPVETTQYIARAFFPSSRKKNVLVDNSIWTSGSYTPANVMGHELGHTLGFRHEHTRPESGTCFEDNNWRPLTPYDKNSIMHYPQCNGVAGQLTFSTNDAVGVRAVYGN